MMPPPTFPPFPTFGTTRRWGSTWLHSRAVKGCAGPQNAGLLLGRKDLIAAAAANNNPFDCVGRGMKVAKEQIVGMVAAVDWFLYLSPMRGWRPNFANVRSGSQLNRKGIPSLASSIVIPATAANADPPSAAEIRSERGSRYRRRMWLRSSRAGTPSIELNPATGHKQPYAGLPTDENTIRSWRVDARTR